MATAENFKKMFPGVTLNIEDLFLLETFQIGYLPGWIPEPEFAVVLKTHPEIGTFLRKKNPDVSEFLDQVEANFSKFTDVNEQEKCCDTIIWTIADLLVYNKCPEAYDNLSFHSWDFTEVTTITPLADKFVIDAGSGTGRVALEAAETAKLVYAVEPVTRLRQFIREKASCQRLNNLFVVDGFLHCLPFPGDSVDVLITSHALGWSLEEELREFERVVQPRGYVIHCPGTAEVPHNEEQHQILISSKWQYHFSTYKESDGRKRKYWKSVSNG
jgi:ubiquinone/menaquinone biosynthesis C-methylase UbiE